MFHMLLGAALEHDIPHVAEASSEPDSKRRRFVTARPIDVTGLVTEVPRDPDFLAGEDSLGSRAVATEAVIQTASSSIKKKRAPVYDPRYAVFWIQRPTELAILVSHWPARMWVPEEAPDHVRASKRPNSALYRFFAVDSFVWAEPQHVRTWTAPSGVLSAMPIAISLCVVFIGMPSLDTDLQRRMQLRACDETRR